MTNSCAQPLNVMRPRRTSATEEPRLQPAGRRWGFGAHSVVQYLAHGPASDARPGDLDGSIRNPVFAHMDRRSGRSVASTKSFRSPRQAR